MDTPFVMYGKVMISMSLNKLCPKCGKVISYTDDYCTECSTKTKANTKSTYRRYKANRTDIREQRFYSSMPWLRMRDTVKVRDKGLCQLCKSNNTVAYVSYVHHIDELKDYWDKRLQPSNLVCLCDSCHKYVHKQYLKEIAEKEKMQKTLRGLIK